MKIYFFGVFMEEQPTCNVQNLGHLGILAAIFKEYKIIERIDLILPKTSNNQNITHGEVIEAMVMQSLTTTLFSLFLQENYKKLLLKNGLSILRNLFWF